MSHGSSSGSGSPLGIAGNGAGPGGDLDNVGGADVNVSQSTTSTSSSSAGGTVEFGFFDWPAGSTSCHPFPGGKPPQQRENEFDEVITSLDLPANQTQAVNDLIANWPGGNVLSSISLGFTLLHGGAEARKVTRAHLILDALLSGHAVTAADKQRYDGLDAASLKRSLAARIAWLTRNQANAGTSVANPVVTPAPVMLTLPTAKYDPSWRQNNEVGMIGEQIPIDNAKVPVRQWSSSAPLPPDGIFTQGLDTCFGVSMWYTDSAGQRITFSLAHLSPDAVLREDGSIHPNLNSVVQKMLALGVPPDAICHVTILSREATDENDRRHPTHTYVTAIIQAFSARLNQLNAQGNNVRLDARHILDDQSTQSNNTGMFITAQGETGLTFPPNALPDYSPAYDAAYN